MFMASIVTPSIIEGLTTSNNPFLYLVAIFIVGFALVAKKVYADIKVDKKESERAAVIREERLIAIDEENRKDSRERENRLLIQLEKTTETFSEITSIVNEISESQKLIMQTQKETVEAVQNLNIEFKDISNRIEKIERIYEE